jgi:hypothetical protein
VPRKLVLKPSHLGKHFALRKLQFAPFARTSVYSVLTIAVMLKKSNHSDSAKTSTVSSMEKTESSVLLSHSVLTPVLR